MERNIKSHIITSCFLQYLNKSSPPPSHRQEWSCSSVQGFRRRIFQRPVSYNIEESNLMCLIGLVIILKFLHSPVIRVHMLEQYCLVEFSAFMKIFHISIDQCASHWSHMVVENFELGKYNWESKVSVVCNFN